MFSWITSQQHKNKEKQKHSIKPVAREECRERLNESREAVKSGTCSKTDAQYLLIRLSACCE